MMRDESREIESESVICVIGQFSRQTHECME